MPTKDSPLEKTTVTYSMVPDAVVIIARLTTVSNDKLSIDLVDYQLRKLGARFSTISYSHLSFLISRQAKPTDLSEHELRSRGSEREDSKGAIGFLLAIFPLSPLFWKVWVPFFIPLFSTNNDCSLDLTSSWADILFIRFCSSLLRTGYPVISEYLLSPTKLNSP